jgi:DNA-binding transcriptional MerR regulator
MTYTIGKVSELTGLPPSTLRYYESENLLRAIRRNDSKRRVYEDSDMDWISLITCLKNTGMPIQEIRRFVTLCGLGDQTLEERRGMILSHKQSTQKRIAALQHELEHINAKVAYYEEACKAGTEAELKKRRCPVIGENGSTADSNPV